jgi:hypothetical protein
VDYEAVSQKVEAITPVPGGVGPMTIAMLLVNTLTAARISIHVRYSRQPSAVGYQPWVRNTGFSIHEVCH